MNGARRSLSWATLLGLLFVAVELLGTLLHAEYPLHQIVWMRYGVHLMLVLLIFGARDGLGTFHTRALGRQVFRSLLMLAMPLCWIAAATLGADGVELAAAVGLAPIMLAVLERLWLARAVNASAWGSAAMASGGAVLLALHHVQAGPPALLAVGAGLCLALYIVETARLRDETLGANLFHTGIWVFLALTPFQAATWVMPVFADVPVLLAIGGCGLLALLALDHMARGASLAASSPLINLQVLVPIALGVAHGLLYPTRSLFAGLLLMAAAAAWAWIASRGHRSPRGLHEPSA